jgi:hypothetical protein
VTGPLSERALEAHLAAFLRTGRADWPHTSGEGPSAARDLLAAAEAHRVVPLLHAAVAAGAGGGWPSEARRELAMRARAEAARDLLRGHALRPVLDALDRAGIPAVVFKGAALAHTVYASPELRPRCDTDVLVDERDVRGAEACLAAHGYRRGPRIRGTLVEYQAPWVREVAGVRCVVDLHWRVSNRQSLARSLPFEALWARGGSCPALGPGVRVPDPVDALQIAAVHGPAHHGGQFQPLLWHYDLHLLAVGLDAPGCAALAARSRARRVTGLVAAALAEAARRFGTPVPDELADAPAAPEPSAALLRRPGRGLRRHDLRHLPDWRARILWLREAALPDTAYLRWRYAAGPETSRTRLLARRALDAAGRVVGRAPTPEPARPAPTPSRTPARPRPRPTSPVRAPFPTGPGARGPQA